MASPPIHTLGPYATQDEATAAATAWLQRQTGHVPTDPELAQVRYWHYVTGWAWSTPYLYAYPAAD